MSNFDPFGDDFDKRFDQMWDRHDKVMGAALSKPKRTIAFVLFLNLVYFFIICGIVAFFVWLLFL